MNELGNYEISEREKAALYETRLFRGLSCAQFEAALLRSRARGARYAKSAIVAEAGSHLAEFIILISGRIQSVRERENGVLDFVQLFVSGEICGLDVVCSASGKSPFRLQALDETELVFIDYEGMFSGHISAEDGKNLRDGVTRTLANESLRRLHKIDVLYRRGLRDRITCYLRNLCAVTGSRSVGINMDREQFAQYLGVNRSALSHELAMMRGEGLIDFYKGSFSILKEL